MKQLQNKKWDLGRKNVEMKYFNFSKTPSFLLFLSETVFINSVQPHKLFAVNLFLFPEKNPKIRPNIFPMLQSHETSLAGVLMPLETL